MTASSGRSTIVRASRERASERAARIRSRLPSRSPTTALIWARASRIETILPVCDSQAKTPSRSSGATAVPLHSGNGGYTAGRLAAFVDGPAEVTLRLPPPLDRPLTVAERTAACCLLDGEALVAEARPGSARRRGAGRRHVRRGREGCSHHVRFTGENFSECFTCGIRPDDGLCIHAGRGRGARPARGAVDARRGLAGGRLGGHRLPRRVRGRRAGPRRDRARTNGRRDRAPARGGGARASSSPGRSARTAASSTPARRSRRGRGAARGRPPDLDPAPESVADGKICGFFPIRGRWSWGGPG